MNKSMITTAFELPGYVITENLGLARGITVRTTSIVGGFAGFIQSLFGGNIHAYTRVCEQARDEAFQQMRRHAQSMGANAIIGLRYDASEFSGQTEVLCYGTAVVANQLHDDEKNDRVRHD